MVGGRQAPVVGAVDGDRVAAPAEAPRFSRTAPQSETKRQDLGHEGEADCLCWQSGNPSPRWRPRVPCAHRLLYGLAVRRDGQRHNAGKNKWLTRRGIIAACWRGMLGATPAPRDGCVTASPIAIPRTIHHLPPLTSENSSASSASHL